MCSGLFVIACLLPWLIEAPFSTCSHTILVPAVSTLTALQQECARRAADEGTQAGHGPKGHSQPVQNTAQLKEKKCRAAQRKKKYGY